MYVNLDRPNINTLFVMAVARANIQGWFFTKYFAKSVLCEQNLSGLPATIGQIFVNSFKANTIFHMDLCTGLNVRSLFPCSWQDCSFIYLF